MPKFGDMAISKPKPEVATENTKIIVPNSTSSSILNDNKTTRQQDNTDVVNESDTVQSIRDIVRIVGREHTQLRMTKEENDLLEDTVHDFKKLSLRTDKNEVSRIGLNYLLIEHQQNGEQSILTGVLQRLNS